MFGLKPSFCTPVALLLYELKLLNGSRSSSASHLDANPVLPHICSGPRCWPSHLRGYHTVACSTRYSSPRTTIR